ncbi:SusD/RagB family nutrient-binding outer membrane lipoprotein [Allomuricauda sp. SCSIO 65647]|uniref:SusD/RagB family nutrient-binding outer membrane lipoprotein n=1 Tax=Allomuricauda sp. SCSIO 65647 TaxID=2908843 RepID=UPI001F379304|nr:SusD/RagB family nutrient-binding outer membrane lipoprotein [Muricauda sp. SCSIO 65647]UJH66552.1 SusD/RagB family nutrient-binding outer membrane lipoprotein [Muricauda sp. SCSIO 65647]
MKKIIKYTSLVLAMLVATVSCETTELGILNDPNASTPESLDVDFTLNSIQFNFSEFFEEATGAGAEAVRLEYMFNEYNNRFQNTNANLQNTWQFAYAVVLQDIETLLPIATESELFVHSGIARTIKAYILMTLVDYWGDVPLSEAFAGGEGNLFPSVDPGADVYAVALAELNEAIADFNRNSVGSPAADLFYGGDVDSWITLVNTLKFKYYLNLRLTNQGEAASQIQSLIDGGNLILDSDNDFVWTAGTADLPLSKHQYYFNEYEQANTGDYISNYLMWTMAVEKGIDDPRLRYYVYRQVDAFPTDDATLDNEIDCHDDPRPASFAPIDAISAFPLPFCSLFGRGDGYWGRDHAEADGIPPDNTKRSTWGVYPAGGRFDDNDAESISAGDGLDGAGIWPIMMDSFVYFMRAEAALTLGTSDDPRTMLESGVRASIARVTGFLPNPGDFTNVPTDTDVEDYVSTVLDLYDAETTDQGRMAVIGKEYWIALFGNGIESFNLYRRTGSPINLQPTLLGLGNFPRTFLYPAVSVDRNPNMQQKSNLSVQTFWDNNPADFVQ